MSPTHVSAGYPGFEGHSLRDLAAAVRRGRVSPVDLVEASLAAIAQASSLGAFLAVTSDGARADARRLARVVARGGTAGPLAGVTIAVKDLVFTKGVPTTAGSRAFPPNLGTERDARAVARLRRAGAIVVGKTNLHEVAFGVTTVNEHYGPARNPWDPARVSGGSSGGSAVAVGARLCAAAIGTDTRGSIRIPAACCGITGFKPSYGRVPLDGVLPLSPTLDHIGPMTVSVDDAALIDGVLAGRLGRLPSVRRRLTVGICDYFMRDLDSGIAPLVEAAIAEFRAMGHPLRELRLPELEEVQHASIVITAAEALAYHEARLQQHPDGYGPLVRKRLEGGAQWTAVDYLRAMETRRRVAAAFAHAFDEVDAIVGATLPALPPRIGQHHVEINGREANTVDAFTRFNAPANMAGLPALSIPCGVVAGLPVGLQLIGGLRKDDQLLALGVAYQRRTDWHWQAPTRR